MVVRKRIVFQAEEALVATIAEGPVRGAHRLQWATKKEAWLMVQPSTLNGTEMGAKEWQDTLFLYLPRPQL